MAWKIATTRVALRSTTGTQDITISGLGAASEIKAAHFICSEAETDGSWTHLKTSIGATDGTRQWTVGGISMSGIAASFVRRDASASLCGIQLLSDSSIDVSFDFNSWITDGVRLNVTVSGASTTGQLVIVEFYAGDDITARADSVILSTEDTRVHYEDMGFEADLLRTGCMNGAFSSSAESFFGLGFGAVHNGSSVVQRAVGYAEANGVAAGGNMSGQIRNDCGAFQQPIGGTTHNWRADFSGFDADGFDVHSRDGNSGGDEIGFLALKIDNADIWLGSVDSPTSTGDYDITAPGFEPSYGVFGMTMLTSENTGILGADGAAFGLSAFDDTREYSHAWSAEYGADPTKTRSHAEDMAAALDAHDATTAFEATLDSFRSNGPRLSVTTANGTTRKWWGLAIGPGGGDDVTPPTVQSMTVNTHGDELSVKFSESVTSASATGLTLDSTGGAVSPTLDSGSGTSTLVYTLSRTIDSAETITADYDDATGDIEDTASTPNALASFTDFAVSNQVGEPIDPPTITAEHCYVFNRDTGRIYYTKSEDGDQSGYSIAKLMTARLLLDAKPTAGDLTETTTIVAADLTPGGSGQNIEEDDVISLHELLWNILLPSSNNSAQAVARVIGQEIIDGGGGGSDAVDRFVEEMNTEATALGMDDTTFTDPHGFSTYNFTAHDAALLLDSVADNEIIREMWAVGRHTMTFERSSSSFSQTIKATNLFAAYPGVRGGKTGTISPTANLSIVWEAPNGQEIVAVVLASSSSANRYVDMDAVLTQLPSDFPEIATSGTPWTPDYLFTTLGMGGAYWSADESDLYQTTDQTTDADSDTDPVGRVEPAYGNSAAIFTQGTAGDRPTLRIDGDEAWFDCDGDDWLDLGSGTIDATGLFADSNEKFMVLVKTLVPSGEQGSLLSRASATAANKTFQLYQSADETTCNFRGEAVGYDDSVRGSGDTHVSHASWDGSVAQLGSTPEDPGSPGTVGTASEEATQRIILGARTNGAGFWLTGRIYSVLIADDYDQDQFRRAMDWMAGGTVNAFRDAGVAVSLEAETGIFTLTGQDAGILHGRQLAAEAASFSVTGNQAGLAAARVVTAETGSFALAGQDAELVAGATLAAEAGAFSVTGQEAGLTADRTVTAQAGAFVLAGQDAELVAGATLAAEAGSFAIAGQQAGLTAARTVTAQAGAFVLAGQDAELVAGATLAAEAGSFSITGQAAGLTADRTVTAQAGAFVLAGQDADLTFAADLTLVAQTGSFAITAEDAVLTHDAVLTADAGAFLLTGQDADLTHEVDRTLTAESGTFQITGRDADLRHDAVITAEAGSFAIAGRDAGMHVGVTLLAEAGSFTITGQDALFEHDHRLAAAVGSFVIAGQPATLVHNTLLDQSLGIDVRAPTSHLDVHAEAAHLDRHAAGGLLELHA